MSGGYNNYCSIAIAVDTKGDHKSPANVAE